MAGGLSGTGAPGGPGLPTPLSIPSVADLAGDHSGARAASRDRAASWHYAEGFVPESEEMERARARAQQLGVAALGPAAGALLRVLCAVARARAVVEVGTGAGVSGLWLLAGMPRGGVLTTVDAEADHQRAARAAFTGAGVRAGRVRAITGRATDVLPRLAEGAYDVVLLDADPTGYAAYLERAVRLLRPSGVLVVAGALAQDRLADPAQRDPVTTALREVAAAVARHEELLPAMVPASGGLLVAVRSPGA